MQVNLVLKADIYGDLSVVQATPSKALKLALDLIPKGSSISMGGCMSAMEIGLVSALKEGEYNFIDRSQNGAKGQHCLRPMMRMSSYPA